ncbi:CxxxxCH/CxxCH domain-containing protein [Geobacter sp.]|uniref:CxxxxCH/CxxCH domain c-type cytochrome n=1 Tax=Geobacter sp. TaxID=46610 RepID=UPI0027BAABF3|nr:CxxxxCH/CxxCH domain-containing protein [Geobacter sp.]
MKAMKVVIPALISVLFFVTADMGAAMECYDCHGTTATADYRPNDAIYRNITTGAFKGNHRTHMGSAAAAGTCAACHGAAAATYTNDHRNGQINMAANINDSPKAGGATYSRGTSFAQSATPVLGTCSNVNCHFETATPVWDAAPFTSPADCNRCHGSAPNTGSHPVTGVKHAAYYGTTTASCVKCHPDHAAEGSPFAHATSAGKRDLAVSFAAAPNSGSGAYSGALNDYLPSQANAFGNCTATYCHSPGNKASGFDPPNTAATWGGSLTCTGCHKADAASGSYLTSGSHGGHLYSWGGLGASQQCARCHAVTATGSMTIAEYSRHVNKQVEVAFGTSTSAASGTYATQTATPASPAQKAPGSAVGQCENVYCHSTGQGDGGTWPPTYRTPTWGTASTGICGTCHGIQKTHGNGAGFYIGTATPLTTGSHAKHLSFIMGFSGAEKCTACHAYTLTGLSPTTCSSVVCHTGDLVQTSHPNYAINVGIPDYYGASASYSGTAKPGDGYGSCSSNYCHSDGKATPTTYATPTWGNAASGACGTCHGVTAAATPASVPHGKHMGSANPYRFACAECHSGKVQVTANSTTAPAFTNLTSHVNKVRNVKFDSTNTFGTYSTATLSCRNLYCHSTGNTSVAAGDLPGVYGGKVYTRITWSGNTTCTSCHGRSTANGMPDYTNAGAPGSATSNSHGKHVASSNFQCVECHEKTTKNNTGIRSTAPSYHVNGTNHDVFFNLSSNSAAGTYDDAQKKCSATYCHGAGASLAWGGTTQCNSCHSANAASSGGGGVNNWGSGTPVSAHKLHWEDASALPSKYANYSTGNLGSAGTYRFACASCHNAASGTHVSGYASGSYRAQVFFGYTSPGKKPTYTYTGAAGTADNGFAWSNGNTTCTATYCHSNGVGGAGNTAVSWTATANSATNTRCKSCHSYTTASGALIATNKHAKHADGATYSFSCAKCHNLTTTDGATIADKTKHVNKVKNVAWDSLNSDGSAYVNSVTACANIYCHSQGTTFVQPYTGAGKAPNTAVTWGGGQTLACNSCHGNANGYTTGTYRVATPLYASGSPKGNAHSSHVDTRLGTDAGTQCLHCHNGTTTTNTSITTYANHVNEAYNVTGGGTYKDGDNVSGAAVAVTVTYAYNASGSTCSNVSCHPTGTAGTKAASTTKWNTAYGCTDCHKVDMNNSTGYHHAMRNYSGSVASYPKAVPGATAGANDVNRRCTMCHVDHATFSPNLNASNTTYGSAGNLRMSIYSSVTATKGYINRDFFKTGSGGICVSCHTSELFKDTGNVRVKNEANSTKTVAIVLDNYTGSAHEYAVASTMKRDSKVFYADCSKCHNSRKGEVAAFSSMTTATHDSDARRLYAGLGATLTDGNDAMFCYRCHSKTTDAIGGTKKTVANKDYYNSASMTNAAEDIHTAFQLGSPGDPGGSPTTSTTTLYLKSSTDESAAEPMSNAFILASGTYSGTTTYAGRVMSPYVGTTAESRAQSTVTTANRYYRIAQFISPPVSSSVSYTTGQSFTLNFSSQQSSSFINGYLRYALWVWNSGDTQGTNLRSVAQYGTEVGGGTTSKTQQAISFNPSSNFTLNVGDKLLLEVEFINTGTTAGTLTAYWGNATDDSSLVLPTAATFTFTSQATPANRMHDVANSGYAGKHKPSPTDETRAYIAANKHISCNDCHDPHEARAGNHTKGNSTLAKVLKGATGVTVTTWGTNWAGVTTWGQTTTEALPAATAEWQICFKCHSGANSNVTSWGGSGAAAWTDLALEFNPNNEAYHPVIQALPSTGNRRLAAGALTGGWTPGMVMTCSDCHSTDSSVSQGPHGSSVKWMLNPNTTGTKYYNWPYTSAADNGKNSGTLARGGLKSSTAPINNTFCQSCHPWSGGGGAHTGCDDHAVACVGCHIRVPHGGKMPRLLTSTNAPGRYKPNGDGTGTTYLGGVDRPGSGTITMGGCWATGGCTAGEHPSPATYSW